jgi:hypothetical protein
MLGTFRYQISNDEPTVQMNLKLFSAINGEENYVECKLSRPNSDVTLLFFMLNITTKNL